MDSNTESPLPQVPPILMAFFGLFALLVCFLSAYALWSNRNDPGRLMALLKQMRGAQPSTSANDLDMRHGNLRSFAVEILNVDGHLQHAFYVSFATDGATEGTRGFSGIRNASFERHPTPVIDANTPMSSGGGIDAIEKNAFVLDSEAQVTGDRLGVASVVYNDTRIPLTAELGLANTVEGGRHVERPAIFLRNGLTAANFDLNTVNIPSGRRIAVRVFGFFR